MACDVTSISDEQLTCKSQFDATITAGTYPLSLLMNGVECSDLEIELSDSSVTVTSIGKTTVKVNEGKYIFVLACL